MQERSKGSNCPQLEHRTHRNQHPSSTWKRRACFQPGSPVPPKTGDTHRSRPNPPLLLQLVCQACSHGGLVSPSTSGKVSTNSHHTMIARTKATCGSRTGMVSLPRNHNWHKQRPMCCGLRCLPWDQAKGPSSLRSRNSTCCPTCATLEQQLPLCHSKEPKQTSCAQLQSRPNHRAPERKHSPCISRHTRPWTRTTSDCQQDSRQNVPSFLELQSYLNVSVETAVGLVPSLYQAPRRKGWFNNIATLNLFGRF